MSYSLWPHGLQKARLPCPSPTLGACSNSCPSSQWFFSQFSHSVVSYSLWPHGLQKARLPCPSPTLGACSNSCPSSQWCHATILSSVVPFSSCLQSFPASGSFQRNQFFTSVKYWSFSFSISPSNEYSGLMSFRIDGFDLSDQGTLKSLLQHHSSKASILWRSTFIILILYQIHGLQIFSPSL